MRFLSLFLVLILFTQTVFAAGKLQGADFKTEAELISAGATKAQLLSDDKIYVTANGINDKLSTAITNGQLGGGSSAGGINILFNESVEFGLTGYTNSGGTLSQQTYSNSKTGDTKYARFIATATSQYYETAAYVVPDSLGAGCQVDFDFKYTSGSWTYSVIDGSANVLDTGTIPSTSTSWQKLPTDSFACPAAGVTVKLRITSGGAGTIESDHHYLGGNKNTSLVDCQGTLACEDVFSARFDTSGVITQENLDWINGNCTNSAGVLTCPLATGLVTQAMDCQCTPDYFGGSGARDCMGTSSTSTTISFTGTSAGTPTNQSGVITCQKQGVDYVKAKPLSAVNSDQSGWFIDANIGGASIVAPIVTSYTPFEDASLDMVLNTGSATAKIPCSSTNSSTGLTCSVGNEQLGVVFTPPYSGYFDVCGYASLNTNSANNIYTQWVRTASNAQTILAEGGSRIGATGATGVTNVIPLTNCGTFYLSSVSETAFRFSYEGNNASQGIIADRNASFGQRDFRVTVRPSTMNVARPVLTGDQVAAPNKNKYKACQYSFGGAGTAASPTVCSVASCAVYTDSCSMISGNTVTRAGTGSYDSGMVTTGWVPGTQVTCTTACGSGRDCYPITPIVANGSGVFTWGTRGATAAGALTDDYFSGTCEGERQ